MSAIKESDVFSDIKNKLIAEIYHQLEEELKFACSWVTGNNDLNILKGRLIKTIYQNHPYEDYLVDGKIILRVWPPEFSLNDEFGFKRNVIRYWKALDKGVCKSSN